MWQSAEELGHRGESSQRTTASTRHDDDDDDDDGTLYVDSICRYRLQWPGRAALTRC